MDKVDLVVFAKQAQRMADAFEGGVIDISFSVGTDVLMTAECFDKMGFDEVINEHGRLDPTCVISKATMCGVLFSCVRMPGVANGEQ